MTQSEIKKAKKLKKLRRKIALKALTSFLVTNDAVDDDVWDEAISLTIENAFAVADEFIRQEMEATV